MNRSTATEVMPPAKIVRQPKPSIGIAAIVVSALVTPGLVKEADRRRARARGQPKDQHDAENESPVADAVGNEGFLRRRRGFTLVDVETDQQIRAQPDAFPADKHQQEVVREHQRQHREHEQVQIGEETIVAAVTVHVAGGENVNQETDEGDEERVDSAQPIHRQTEVCPEVADVNPGPQMIHDRLRRSQRAI